ncbi:hypothetical protein Cpap_0873 [Ruminiclostridium papyrosolvens DSM 2782]|uniref:Uncharacterized protein n=1 Tax=Ruminiclostridium papyrosolvens DSM 2782 TaxID=588581 RepID=F1TH21_9FIRM|nr:DUF5677 domain-containing protein [Ruminiclostridium papyrosolvens]EGD46261.1 hypothetical protein Cpap_0873 [Ruminiclostridium papyrosolvens DSM 2782]WES33017.1 DUF5677 domain-containing protein [Ruminiclostridium papyrosolvens DSM 2782]
MEVDTYNILYNLSGRANSLMRECFNVCSPLYKKDSDIPYNVQFVFIQLFSSSYLSSESALILIANYRLWDTEIIYRSILEGTIKLFYLSYGSKKEIQEKCDEFWFIIPETKLITRHYKAQEMISKLDDNSSKYVPVKELLLSDEELQKLRDKYPKKYISHLNQKWSFSEMIKVLANSDIQEFDKLASMYYGYSLGSHFTHQDGDGIGMIWDRQNRDTKRRLSIELAHGSRFVSDILSLTTLRTTLYLKFYGVDPKPMTTLYKHLDILFKETENYYKEWFEIEYENK